MIFLALKSGIFSAVSPRRFKLIYPKNSKLKKPTQAIFIGIIFILAGTNHFVMPNFYLQIMPPYLPFPLSLVYLSGIAEVVCGVLLILKSERKRGAWLTILLLIAVFPANIQLSINEYQNGGTLFYISLLRLPFQLVFIWFIYRFTKTKTD